MNLNTNYSGKTLLKNWWTIVRDNFKTIQDAHNTEVSERQNADSVLQTNIDDEVTARTNGDSALQSNLNTHASEKATGSKYSHVELSDSVESTSKSSASIAATPYAVKQAYDKAAQGVSDAAAVQSNLNSEISARQSADSTLQTNINTEVSARKSADTALDTRVTAVEETSHTHANKSVIDGITADDVENWNGITEQVTQTQLDAAIAAEAEERDAADNGIIESLSEHEAYADELFYGLLEELLLLRNLIGVTSYDGGIFGMAQDGAALNGGDFDSEIEEGFDCGGFEPLATAVVDGGQY